MYSFPYLETVCCSMSSSNCCFLTCIQISQEAGLVVCYSHFLKNFPEFVVIHTVKGFGIVNKAEIDVFLELSCFLMIQWMLAIWSLVPLPFLNPAWTSGSSWFVYCWSLAWRILSITLLACEMGETYRVVRVFHLFATEHDHLKCFRRSLGFLTYFPCCHTQNFIPMKKLKCCSVVSNSLWPHGL